MAAAAVLVLKDVLTRRCVRGERGGVARKELGQGTSTYDEDQSEHAYRGADEGIAERVVGHKPTSGCNVSGDV